MPTSYKGKRRFSISKAVIMPWYDFRSKIGFYIGCGIGIIYCFVRIRSIDFGGSIFLSILEILTNVLIYLICGPLVKVLIAAINSSRLSYLEVWVIHNEAGRLCKVIDITSHTNHDPIKVLNRWLDSYTDEQIELQMLYYEEKYEDAFIAIK